MMDDENEKRFQLAYNLSGYQPNILFDPKKPTQLIISSELVDHQDGKAQRTGKYIHLGMTTADAMRLLGLLSAVQQQFGFEAHSEPIQHNFVPPKNEQN